MEEKRSGGLGVVSGDGRGSSGGYVPKMPIYNF